MYVGIGPPHPKSAAEDLRKNLVDPGLLEEEYAKMLEDVVGFRKKVEYKEIEDITGAQVDEWIKKTERYVERFEKLLKDLETRRKEDDIKRNYDVMVKASVAALRSLKKLPEEPEKLPEAFTQHLVESGIVSPLYSDIFDKVLLQRKALEDKNLDKVTEGEIYSSKEYVRRFVNDVRRFIEPVPQEEIKAHEEPKKVPKKS
jgi:uncharacterized protein (UPF0332 family)